MRSTLGGFCLLTLVAATAAKPAVAQDSTKMMRRAAALVLDHTFSSPGGEPIRVFLAEGTEYRAYIDNAGKMTLTVKPLAEGEVPPPLVMPLLSGTDASGEATYTVKPKADAVYVFSSEGGDPASPVHLRLVAVQKKPSVQKKP